MFLFTLTNLFFWLLLLFVLLVFSISSTQALQYDLIVIGGGAGGMFAAGAASSIFQTNKKTAILDLQPSLGGDCSNAACVPSKALRSAARQTVRQSGAQEHQPMSERNPNLDVHLVQSCRFLGTHALELAFANSTVCTIESRRFLLAVGAAPVVPSHFAEQAKAANLFLWTYRSILKPENLEFWDCVQRGDLKRLLIVGGGPTACELGQSLGRLLMPHNTTTTIELVAPAILPDEDSLLQQAAETLLTRAGVSCRLNVKLDRILSDQSILLSDGSIVPPVDGILLCVGRSPPLDSLHLDQAGVPWTENGVQVRPSTLQSIHASHIYAAGDCADLLDPRSRTSAHAAWMGFHAVRNMYVPWLLRAGSSSQHKVVPRVIYTDPELARVGLTHKECKERYPDYRSVHVCEEGSDRADMERGERDTDVAFLELRASPNGRILGCTACGPAAAELANSIGVAITNGLSVKHIASSIHSYPSHGYLLYRVALSMALSDMSGFLASCGPVGKVLGWMVGVMNSSVRVLRSVARSVLRGLSRRKSL